jgi:hypothetical protein
MNKPYEMTRKELYCPIRFPLLDCIFASPLNNRSCNTKHIDLDYIDGHESGISNKGGVEDK